MLILRGGNREEQAETQFGRLILTTRPASGFLLHILKVVSSQVAAWSPPPYAGSVMPLGHGVVFSSHPFAYLEAPPDLGPAFLAVLGSSHLPAMPAHKHPHVVP